MRLLLFPLQFSVVFALALVGADLTAAAQSIVSERALTVEDVVRLVKAGFPEELVITKVKRNARPFDLNADELLELKSEGVTDNIIRYLLDPSLPYTPPAPPVPATSGTTGTAVSASANGPSKNYPGDALASHVPPDPGLYLFASGAPVRSELKPLLGIEESKTLIKKAKTIAYLIGEQAKAKAPQASPTAYIRLPEGHEIQELVLLELSEKEGRREVMLGPTPAKPELKSDVTHQFDSTEVGPHLFKVNTGKLEEGEYLFYLLGSADPSKGIYGKGFDFSIPEEPHRK